ncbi:MAG: hypothetical protein ACTHMC_19885 [Pseudobacter sp.]|uniref:hypothetical protein n=1 Tax=Pseudobacter sp. TaxID=2045420 RepID=UPI003F7D386C
MKKFIIIALATVLATAASAMPAVRGGHGWHGGGYLRPRTTVVLGGGWYNPWYGPWGFYGYPGYPYPTVPATPSRLDLQLSSIRVNYADKIRSARMDKDLTREARRKEISTLKTEREKAIIEAKKNFYKY